MASLPDWSQFSRRPSLLLTWTQEGTTSPQDLTGATITGSIRRGGTDGTVAAITGTFAVTDGPGGVFRWDFSALDVVNAGPLEVQFTATFASGQSPAKTLIAKWKMEEALV